MKLGKGFEPELTLRAFRNCQVAAPLKHIHLARLMQEAIAMDMNTLFTACKMVDDAYTCLC